ncbi:MAG TPA: hypothetical protein PLQ76_06040, partial [bacterium]|nr:hypothetical protein [bacterium]
LLGAKMTPFEAADLLDAYAAESLAALARAEKLADPSSTEFKSLSLEANMLSHLAKYYSAKIRAATYLNFLQKKGTYDELRNAKKYTMAAIDEWNKLSDLGVKNYLPILDTLRMRGQVKKNTFTWKDVAPQLDADKRIIEGEDKRFTTNMPAQGEPPAVLHVPTFNALEGAPLRIAATILTPGNKLPKSVALFYRSLGSQDFKSVALAKEGDDPIFSGELPAADAKGKVEYYISAEAADGKSSVYPGKQWGAAVRKSGFSIEEYYDGSAKKKSAEMKKLRNTEIGKYILCTFSKDRTPPQLSVVATNFSPAGDNVEIKVAVKEESPVKKIRIFYKNIPSNYTWIETDMEKGADGLYSINLKLTPEGLLYYFEASDEAGNATAYPYFMKQTPYLIIDSWDPATNPYAR